MSRPGSNRESDARVITCREADTFLGEAPRTSNTSLPLSLASAAKMSFRTFISVGAQRRKAEPHCTPGGLCRLLLEPTVSGSICLSSAAQHFHLNPTRFDKIYFALFMPSKGAKQILENIFQSARFAEPSFYASLKMSSIYSLPGCFNRHFQCTDCACPSENVNLCEPRTQNGTGSAKRACLSGDPSLRCLRVAPVAQLDRASAF